MCEQVTKARKRGKETWRRQRANQQAKLVRGMAPVLSGWMQRYAVSLLRERRRQVERAMAAKKPTMVKVLIQKQFEKDKLERELADIYRRYGLRSFDTAGKDAARAAGGQWEIRPDILASYNDELDNRVVLLIRETEGRVRDSIRRIVSDALREDVVPSSREVGRRIARQWMGPPSARPDGSEDVWPGRGTAEDQRLTADWARTQDQLSEGGKEYLFNFQRAQTIARTEIGQAQQAATAEGFALAGVAKVEWLARPFNPNHDGPGKRNHYLMNKHKPITLAAMQSNDKERWFRLPSGERTPYPQWIGLSAGESVNCQCATAPA